MYVNLLTDTGMVARLASTGSLAAQLGHYEYVQDLQEVLAEIDEIYSKTGKLVEVALDLETVGLDEYRMPDPDAIPPHPGAYIVSIQVSHVVGKSSVIRFNSKEEEESRLSDFLFAQQVSHLLSSSQISLRGANLKFDLRWLWVRGGFTCTNFKFDTTLVGSLLDENRVNGLDVHAKIYAPDLAGYSDEFDRTIDKSRMDLVPTDKFLLYSGGDTDADLRVSKAMKSELLQDPQLTAFYVNILHPAARAFEVVERGGIYIDRDKFRALEADLNEAALKLVHRTKKIIGGILVARHSDDSKAGGMNITKASLITEYMFSKNGLNLKPVDFTEKTKAPATGIDHLLKFKDVPEAAEFVSCMKEYAAITKTLGTYVTGFLKCLRSDGKFHPSYFFFVGDKDDGEGGANCMPAGELVLTSRGYLPVEKVRVGDKVISHTGKPRAVIQTLVNGVKPIIKVTLSNGLILRTTPNHAYRVVNSWVEATDLKIGMQVWAHSGVEEWEPIFGWEDFEVSSWGRVYNKKSKRFITQYPKGKWGHLKVCLYRNGAQKRGIDRKDFSIHKLVADAFLEKWGGGELRHLNGVAWDNTVGNLVWGSSKENKEDAIKHGTLLGRNNRPKKLKFTQEDVDYIRTLPIATRSSGITNEQLAKKYNVNPRTIRQVRSGDRWRDYVVEEKTALFKLAYISKIEIEVPEMTYGVTVEIDHSHVTGGVMTHNTGRLSCKAPAFQCLVGDSLVRTDQGLKRIDWLVENRGAGLKVLTHTGKWQPIVGTYKNGCQSVYRLQFSNGYEIRATGNHPILTARGWVRTDNLAAGDTAYADQRFGAETSSARVHKPNLALMECHERQVLHSDRQGLSTVRSHWSYRVPEVASIRELSLRHGSAPIRNDNRQIPGQEWQLRTWELSVGNSEGTAEQSTQYQVADSQGANQNRVSVGGGSWNQQGAFTLQTVDWDADGASIEERAPADRNTFQEVTLLSVTPDGVEQTYDLTVHSSHSFVANGIVVHNTIPVHTVWAPRIQECYIAPPGYLIGAKDYSQGELRVIACIANETNMIEAYRNNLDLHSITSGKFAGYTYDEMMVMKNSPDKALQKLFKETRQLGKAGNFGKIYGMGVDGFIIYAYLNYGVTLSKQQAQDFHDSFFGSYPILLDYHEQQRTYVKRHRMVRSPLGRIRHLPLIASPRQDIRAQAERQSINSPTQSTLSDMMLWSFAEMQAQYPDLYEDNIIMPFGAVHDSGYDYLQEDRAEDLIKMQIEVMENLPFHKVGWNPQLKFVADGKLGKDMWNLEEI